MKKNSLEIIKKTKSELTTPEDMKMKIREYIDKLNDSSTRDLYFKNFKNLLQTYTDEKSVEIIFPLLLSYTNDAMTLIGKEYQIILIAFALNVDFVKNINFTLLTKILKSISNFLEKNNNFEIQKACSVVTIEIFDQLIKMGENCENAFSFIIKFFFDLIEKNKAIVSMPKDNGILNGAFVIISDLLLYVININSKNTIEQSNDVKNEKIEEINRKIERDEIEKASNLNSLQKILEETLFNLINKLISFKYPNPFLIEAITYLIDVIVYDDYKNKINELIPHLNKVLYNPDAKIYLSKIMICHLYSHLFKKMNLTEENKNIEEIIKALNYTTKDRVVKVQIAAEEALLIYNNLTKEENSEVKTKRKMSKLNLLRNLSKINKEKNNIMSSQKVRKEIYDIGIGKFLRSNDYLNNRDEENLLMLKNEINKSKEKKDKKERSRSIPKKKRKKFKMNSDNKLDGGIMIFQRYNGFNEEISKENDANNINDNNNKFKSAKNNSLKQNLKNDDINLNSDIESIKKSISKKEKERTETDNGNNEHEEKENEINNDEINNNEINNNEIKNNEIKNNEINISNKQSNNIKIIENLNDDNDNNNKNKNDIINDENDVNNDNNNNNKNEIIKEKEKAKDLFKFQEEQNNIGDQSNPNYKEIISEKKTRNKSKKNKRKKSKDNSETNEKIEKLGNSNNDLNISDNIDSSNIQGNTVEDINRINTLSKRSSQNKTKNIRKITNEYNNDLFNQLNKTFNDELDKLVNDFNANTNNKLNKINNRLLGLSQNINRIKSNFNLLKHTNNLNFKDSNVIINEENEEQSFDSSMTKNEEKYNIKSHNILWETISLYLKNENYEEAFIKALQGKDDIIFLRLIFSLGTNCLQFISINTNKLIIKHFNSIFRTFSIQNQFLEYIQAFYNMKMLNIKYFSLAELNDFMQTLFEIKSLNNDTGKQAQYLYNNILQNFSSNK